MPWGLGLGPSLQPSTPGTGFLQGRPPPPGSAPRSPRHLCERETRGLMVSVSHVSARCEPGRGQGLLSELPCVAPRWSGAEAPGWSAGIGGPRGPCPLLVALVWPWLTWESQASRVALSQAQVAGSRAGGSPLLTPGLRASPLAGGHEQGWGPS